MAVIEVAKRVRVIGTSLSFILPASMARALGVDGFSMLYVCVSGGELLYAAEPPRPGECDATPRRLRPRVIARHGGRRYFVLTVPSRLARILGIAKGDTVALRLEGSRLRVRKL